MAVRKMEVNTRKITTFEKDHKVEDIDNLLFVM